MKKRLNSRIYSYTLANQGSRAKREVLIIIDGNALIHRAYHALPPLTTKKGELINAVYGFLLVFLKAIKEFQPNYIAATFDLAAPTFRHKKFKEYKAKRPPAPEELYQQIPKIKEILKNFNIPIFEKEGFEADDIIGTIAKKAETLPNFPKKNLGGQVETIILSGDLDVLQLVNKNTKVYTLKKGLKDTILYDEKAVERRYEISPAQLIDFKALRGDLSDNIPGIIGIGEKTALKLIKEFGSLENLYKAIEQRPLPEAVRISLNQQLRAKLAKYRAQAFLSKMLVQIREDVPIDFSLKRCRWGEYDKGKVTQILKNFEFYSLINRLPEFKKSKQRGKIKKVKVEGPRSEINLLRGKQKTLF